jgi:uncharacterized protein YndB with AHSA1/START domain
MQKTKIELEYELKSPSLTSLWPILATPQGLSEWFADDVVLTDDLQYIFTWDKHSETATLIELKPMSHIRFRWIADEDTDCFFEIKIAVNELTGDVVLYIADFANEDDINDIILLWDNQIEALKRKNGL